MRFLLPIIIGVIILILLLIFLMVVYWLPKWPARFIHHRFFPEVQINLAQSFKNGLALTFDDVPRSNQSFTQILDLLKQHQCQATFFIISGQVQPDNRPLLIRALREGHQLANHGQSDSVHIRKAQPEFEAELEHCHNLIKELYREANQSKPKQRIYRPGSGWFNRRMINYLNSRKYRLVLGSVYPNDPLIRNARLNFLYLRKHLQPGDIVILHDRDWTPALLERLLPWIKAQGWFSQTLAYFDD